MTNDNFFVTGEELLARDVQEMPMLVDPLFPKTGTVALAGESSLGKSSFLLQLGIAITSGDQDFLGYPLNAQYNHCMIVSTEDDDNAMAYKLQRFKNIQSVVNGFGRLRFLFDSSELFSKLEAGLQAQRIDLLIVDCFADLCVEDMNTSNRVRSYINKFSQLAAKYGFLVFFLHHSTKRSQYNMPSKDNLLGSQGFEAKCRLVIELRRDWHDPTVRHMCIVKANYLSDEMTRESYALKFDDNQRFTSTGRREPFENLIAGKIDDRNAALQKEICQCIASGTATTARAISDYLHQKGIRVGKTKVGELLKNCETDDETED